ncbi:hypothetical protein GWE18_29220 [Bradyrhizobium sp. CSA112]|uniref:hypothetical protein n=1 Tax=Bradyrhizobium sp. CSA112 TaxID=2699170 RepID=UPI0023B15AAA|nr:hypothetical protein [Bradyrhizobium sp. CSA112]MDE5456836.1 hypothetical protein [Bradyrhizobium sp. CSA112]
MAELVANAEMLIRRPVAEVFGRITARLIDGRSARARRTSIADVDRSSLGPAIAARERSDIATAGTTIPPGLPYPLRLS